MLIQRFLDYMQTEKRASSHTITAYRTDLISFERFMKLSYSIDDLVETQPAHIRDFAASLMEEEMAAKTVNRKLSSVRSFFKFLQVSETVEVNPVDIKSLKVPKRLVTPVSLDDITRLLDEVEFPEGFAGIRDRAILETFYTTGLRRQELLDLKTQDLDFAKKILTVKSGKGGRQRNVPLMESALRTLSDYLKKRQEEFGVEEPWLFLDDKGKKMSSVIVYNLVNYYLRQVSTLKKTSPHVLRHTFATHMLNQGADIMVVKELLGHKTLAATELYTHVELQQLKSVYNQAHPRKDEP